MGTLELKKSLIGKTITNLEADITRKGTWAYQNALAIESILSSDKFINDKVQEANEDVSLIADAKASVKKDTEIVRYGKEFPNRSSENQYFKELSNGELLFFNRGTEKYVFISRDAGTTWEVLFDRVALTQNEKTLGLETAYFDIEYINGHYVMSWTGTTDATEKLYVGKIVNNGIEDVEELLSTANAITDITVSSDSYKRTVVVYRDNNILYVGVKQNDGTWALVNANASTTDVTYYARNFFVDSKGYFWLVQSTDSRISVTRIDLSDQGTTPTVSFFTENTGEAMTNEGIFGAFWKEGTVFIVRYGKNSLLFNVDDKEFIDTNFTLTAVNECVVVDADFNIIVGRQYSNDLGMSWKTLPVNKLYIQTSMSNLYENASTYRNYVVTTTSDSTTVNVQHNLIRISDFINNDEIIL